MSPRVIREEDLIKREAELIDTALDIMKDSGTAGLTMDKVVARVPYSKGTVYSHFISKEDLLTGVCNTSMGMLVNLFQRAVNFDGTPRERILTLLYGYLLHARLHPQRFMLVVSAKTDNLMERTSSKRLEEHQQMERNLMGSMAVLVETAVEHGEFTLPSHMTIQQVVFSIWATSFGVIALLISTVQKCSGRDELDVEREAINNANLLLDGLNWHPLSREFDYQITLRRIASEVYADELAQIEATLKQ